MTPTPLVDAASPQECFSRVLIFFFVGRVSKAKPKHLTQQKHHQKSSLLEVKHCTLFVIPTHSHKFHHLIAILPHLILLTSRCYIIQGLFLTILTSNTPPPPLTLHPQPTKQDSEQGHYSKRKPPEKPERNNRKCLILCGTMRRSSTL